MPRMQLLPFQLPPPQIRNICKSLSLTGHEVIPDDFKACHQLQKKRLLLWNSNPGNKRKIFIDRKNLQNNSENLNWLKFAGRVLISDSMCHENHQLPCKCKQLKNAGKMHSTWFWNNAVNIKLDERSRLATISHYWLRETSWCC